MATFSIILQVSIFKLQFLKINHLLDNNQFYFRKETEPPLLNLDLLCWLKVINIFLPSKFTTSFIKILSPLKLPILTQAALVLPFQSMMLEKRAYSSSMRATTATRFHYKTILIASTTTITTFYPWVFNGIWLKLRILFFWAKLLTWHNQTRTKQWKSLRKPQYQEFSLYSSTSHWRTTIRWFLTYRLTGKF